MIRVRAWTIAAAAALVASTMLATIPAGATGPGVEPDLAVEEWLDGVSVPWDIAFTHDGYAVVPQRDARSIVVRSPNGSVSTIDADLSDVNNGGEGGLLGLVLDPDFDQNRRFYTCQTTSSAVEVVSWTMNQSYTGASRVKDPLVGGIDRSSGRHSGCRLRFGYEGYLWIATGDAARGTTPQDLGSLAGKVLRVKPETGSGAPGNPFIGVPGDNRIYSYGHRNPQGLDRRPCTSQMWTGEHGPAVDDEVNLIVNGGNYGWNPVPGYNEGVPMTDFGLPGPQRRAKWRSGAPTVALSGIGWIRGADWGAWDGELAGATLKNQRLMVFEFRNNNSLADVDVPPELNGSWGRLRTAVMGPDGSLYVTSDGAGAVLRVTPASGPTPGDQDINGDGYDDLIVGAPGKVVNGRDDAGAFTSLYGGSGGIRPASTGSEARDQDNIKGATPGTGDGLGSSVAYGDIDGDGLTDVVVGSPNETAAGKSGSGAIHVICGRTNGVEGRSSQTFSQAGSVAGKAEAGDRFGQAVAVGDFDNDGYDDVASGAPREDAGATSDAGAVTVLMGTSAGLTTEASKIWTQSQAGGATEAGDRFGSSLATGDFNGDGYDDLAIGAPYERTGGLTQGGAVSVLFGSSTGLTSAGAQFWTQADLPGNGIANDRFGEVLEAGDFDDDGRDDLAIGIPAKTVSGQSGSGAVVIARGSNSGLTSAGAISFTQNNIPGASEAGDHFGGALTEGDFNGDGTSDLAVGSSGENNDRGRVVIFHGAGAGLSFARSFSAAGPVAGKAEAGDRFGASLRSGDFNNDGYDDLGVGVPAENAGGFADTGAVVVLNGSGSGIVSTGSKAFNQASAGVKGRRLAGDLWGSAM